MFNNSKLVEILTDDGRYGYRVFTVLRRTGKCYQTVLKWLQRLECPWRHSSLQWQCVKQAIGQFNTGPFSAWHLTAGGSRFMGQSGRSSSGRQVSKQTNLIICACNFIQHSGHWKTFPSILWQEATKTTLANKDNSCNSL